MEYSKPYLIAHNGAVLAQAESVEVSYASNDKPVRTLLLGLAGFSDGAQEVTMNMRNAIPQRGFEKDFADFLMRHVTLQFTIREANVISTFEGRILSGTSTSSVDSPNGINVNFHGRLMSRSAI